MKKSTKVLIAVLVAFIAIQFVPVNRTNPPVEQEVSVPPAVKAILKTSCYDCHSNETKWLWYSYVAPVSWLVANDVKEAREKLNFSTWNKYDAEKRADHLEDIWEEVSEGEMPLTIYLIMHAEARPTDKEKATLHNWVMGNTQEGAEHEKEDED